MVGLEGQQIADQAHGAVLALARRHVMRDPVGEDDQADLVIVADRAEREDRREFGGNLALRPRHAAEQTRGAEIDQQHDRELALLDILFDERRAHARGNVPVDRTHVVAGHILANLGELDPAALEHAVILAGENAVDQAPGLDRDLTDLSVNFSGQPRGSRRL